MMISGESRDGHPPGRGGLLLGVVRAVAVLVTLLVSTLGSFVVGFAIGTDCTSGPYRCGATQTILTVGWVVQGLLLVVAVGLCLPPLARRLGGRGVLVAASATAVAAPVLLALTAWVASVSY